MQSTYETQGFLDGPPRAVAWSSSTPTRLYDDLDSCSRQSGPSYPQSLPDDVVDEFTCIRIVEECMAITFHSYNFYRAAGWITMVRPGG